MAQQENKIPLSKKNQREISPFIGHELLYDYLMSALDPDRRAAVEDHVKFSRDAQLDLNKIENGLKYAEQLSATRVSEPIIAQINAPSSYLNVLMQKSNFDKWPQGLKWGLEALVVVGVIVIFLSVTPWQKALQLGQVTSSKEVVLAEVSKSETAQVIEEKPEFVDEGVKEAAKSLAPEQPPVAAVTPKPLPTPTGVATTKAEKTAEAATVAVSGGFLYRGALSATNIETIGPKIAARIQQLGGRKAGSVELGWKKTGESMYYHFTIPEAKYPELLTYLEAYGKPRFAKEKHPRVMPDGIVRLIFTLEESKK